jgi:hypothetical protein
MDRRSVEARTPSYAGEQVFYWGWLAEDNPKHSYFSSNTEKLYRVFRVESAYGADSPLTEPMSRDEAIKYCERIVKLTGGREIR